MPNFELTCKYAIYASTMSSKVLALSSVRLQSSKSIN